jgi:hypothetical protein
MIPVGVSLLAMDVNDNAHFLDQPVALKPNASKLAPAGVLGLGAIAGNASPTHRFSPAIAGRFSWHKRMVVAEQGVSIGDHRRVS